MTSEPPKKPLDSELVWLGRTKQTVSDFPPQVKREVGFALRLAQQGRKSISSKPLTGEKAFRGASVLEIVEDDDGNTYRTAYAAKFPGAVYVLHAFQKKSTKGVATPRKEIDLIKDRLAEAARHHAENRTAENRMAKNTG